MNKSYSKATIDYSFYMVIIDPTSLDENGYKFLV